MFVGIGLIFVPITVITYRRINLKRAEVIARMVDGSEKKLSPDEIRALGDRAPDFVYTIWFLSLQLVLAIYSYVVGLSD